MSLTLYVDSLYASPWALSVFVALTEKGLPFTVETVDLESGQNKLPAYRDLLPTTRIPALVHDGFVLSESTAIAEYLDDVFPAPQYTALYPSDPQQRARVRQIQSWLRSDLAPVRGERNTETVFFQRPIAPLTAEGQECAAKLIAAAERLIDGPHLFGQWSIADTDLTMMLNRLILNGDPVPQRIQDYAAGQWRRPSVQQWLARHQPQ